MRLETNDLRAALRRLSPKVTGALLHMRRETYRDGAVPAKYKLLTALAVAIALRCEPCIRAYVAMAHKSGVTRRELIEFLEVTIVMQGCPGEEWAVTAYVAYKECESGAPPTESPSCCTH